MDAWGIDSERVLKNIEEYGIPEDERDYAPEELLDVARAVEYDKGWR